MSFFDDYEEISLSDDSTKHSDLMRRTPVKKPLSANKVLASRLATFKSNPDTFDADKLVAQMKRPVKFSSNSPPVVERMLFSHQLSLNRKRFLSQEKEYLELKNCPFKPKLRNLKKKRSFKDFYEEQTKFVSNKADKIADLKLKQEKQLCESEKSMMHKVQISSGSKKILNKLKKPVDSAPDAICLYKTVCLSQGICKSFGKPPLPKPKLN